MSPQPIAKCDERASWMKRLVPALDWLAHYERKHLPGDALAGVIVAALLIPQGMAYALLAGLPPQFGLYASILPLAVYALLGSSRAGRKHRALSQCAPPRSANAPARPPVAD